MDGCVIISVLFSIVVNYFCEGFLVLFIILVNSYYSHPFTLPHYFPSLYLKVSSFPFTETFKQGRLRQKAERHLI